MKQKVVCFSMLLMMILSIFIPARAEDTQYYDEQLKMADSLKSSDPAAFSLIISDLKKESTKLTTQQLDVLKYLTGYELTFKGKLDDAVVIYKSVINSEAGQALKLKSNLSIVNIYALSHNWTDGLAYLADALNISDSVSDDTIKAHAFAIAAVFYNQLGQYELGLAYAKRLSKQATDVRNKCIAAGLITEAEFKLNQLTENSKEIQQSRELCQQANEIIMVSLVDTYLAEIFIAGKQPEKALDLLKSSLNIAEDSKYPPVLSKLYSLLATVNLQLSEDFQAKLFSNKTLNISEKNGYIEPTAKAYNTLYQLAKKEQQFSKALEYHEKYVEADKSYLNEIEAKQLAFQLAQHKAIQQENQIISLGNQNKLLLLEQKLASSEAENNRLYIALLILCVAVLLALAYRSHRTHRRLQALAQYDALTGAYNRGHFTQVATALLENGNRQGQQLGCILLDLDNFKAINDSYGHACGDWVLQSVARICAANIRKGDIFARLGGEEFLLLLPGCSLERTLGLAEGLRQRLAAIDTGNSGFAFDISASFGVTDTALSGFSLEPLLADADAAMYQAKNAGRDRVCRFSAALRQQDLRRGTASKPASVA